ncbi:MAG: hypothetical protein H0U29_06880 [Acidimicrobiia bacterium]|nr:hypothetical protein [Acidimicrobiia bacterium]
MSGGRLGGAVTLTAEAPATALELRGRAGQLVELHGDRTFSPCWWGDADPRLLSFTLDEA